ncbi:hypothetical protein H8I91_20695, partial [Serratia fonticola]
AGYDALIARFEGSDDNKILLRVAMAMYSKAYNAANEAAKQAGYDALIARFEGSDDNAILLQVAKSFINMANIALSEGKIDSAAEFMSKFKLIHNINGDKFKALRERAKLIEAMIGEMK